MKLTNYIRDAFINSVMNDVPTKDYAAETQKVFMPAYLATLPKVIQDAWGNPETKDWVNTAYAAYCHQSFQVPSKEGRARVVTPPKVQAKLDEIKAAYDAQSNAIQTLRTKIKGAAYACNTTKQLRELLPEFDRYLPAEEEKTLRTLPVVQNIVADFVEAGWPAKKKAVAA